MKLYRIKPNYQNYKRIVARVGKSYYALQLSGNEIAAHIKLCNKGNYDNLLFYASTPESAVRMAYLRFCDNLTLITHVNRNAFEVVSKRMLIDEFVSELMKMNIFEIHPDQSNIQTLDLTDYVGNGLNPRPTTNFEAIASVPYSSRNSL